MTNSDANPDQMLAEGYQLDDYRITALLGRGGFGITYKGLDERLQRAVAIKEYLPQQFAYRDASGTVKPRTTEDDETFEWGLRRFVDEARALALFRHPNIVSVIRYLDANGTAYLVMDYEEGADLKHFLADRNEQIDEHELVDGIVLPLLDGLQKVHDQGLLHRDIKPDNIFIRTDGSPVLIDFGAARPHALDATQNMTSIISAGYSPFEQYGGGDRQGPWSDIYALAGTLYRVVTGQAPLDAIVRHQNRELVPAVEAARGEYKTGLLEAIDKGLDLDPAARPQSAAEFRALITRAAPDDDATYVRRVPERQQNARGGRRNRLIGALAVALLSIAAAGYLVTRQFQSPPQTSAETEQNQPAIEVESPLVVDAAENTIAQPPALPGTDGAAALPPDVTTTAEPGSSSAPVAANVAAVVPEPVTADENSILADLDIPGAVQTYRMDQLAGALLAYVSNKQRFDACLKEGCAQQLALMSRVQEALEGYEWTRDEFSGSIRVSNPRRLNSEACPFMLDVTERIRWQGTERSQVRTYCTTNGFDRELQKAQPIQSRALSS